MRSVSLSHQLLLLFGGLTAAVIGSTLLSGQGLFQLAEDIVASSQATEAETGRIYALLEGSSSMQSRVQVILGQKDPDIIEAKLAELQASEKEIRNAFSNCGSPCFKAATSFERLVEVNKKTIELFLGGNLADSYASLATDVAPKVDDLLDEIRMYSQGSALVIREKNLATGAKARFRAAWVVGLSSVIALAIVVIGTWFRRRLAQRLLSTVQGIEQIAQGRFDQRVPTLPKDELGNVGSAVNSMAEKIVTLLRSIEDKNKDLQKLNANLENLVAERTEVIRTILDNVNIGLLICDPHMIVKEGYSAECGKLFGRGSENLAGQSLCDLLRLKERSKAHFKSLYKQIFDKDFMLGDLAILQLPNRMTLDGKDIQLVGSVLKDGAGSSVGALFCLSDITTLVSAEKQNARNQSLVMMIHNRNGFQDFVRDAELIFATVKNSLRTQPQDVRIARNGLHTLKGNASIYGLKEVSDRIHDLEGQTDFTVAEIEGVEQIFADFLREHHPILGLEYSKRSEETFTVPLSIITKVESASSVSTDVASLRQVILDFFFRIRMKQASTMLGPIDAAMNQLAQRLGKQLRFEVKGGSTLIPDSLAPFFRTLPHLLRNAVDHGLEAPAERGSKAQVGTITLTISSDDKIWSILVEDDGRGIDGDRLCEEAIKRGMLDPLLAAQMSPLAKQELIFHEGFSTADQATDISGRGFGMSSVKQSVELIGGRLGIESTIGKGTRILITLPLGEQSLAYSKVA